MGKVWFLEETGEVRSPLNCEFYLYGEVPYQAGHEWKAPMRILKLTEFSENPLTLIQEFYNENKDRWHITHDIFDTVLEKRMWEVFCESMRRMGK